ncbi:MAG: hypothetical protein JWM11_3614 [Planctomycetaceae bacterium]|nr:hypothetical protein [Planctomycetaceae bacterium]
MTNQFPGIDPFIECQEWEDFHATFNTVLREVLTPQIEPRYIVRVERRVYVELPFERDLSPRRPDVAVLFAEQASRIPSRIHAGTAVVTPEPALIPMPEERRESYLVIRDRESLEVVTVIETLSPANKRRESTGRREYLQKRELVLESHSHLVEFDLLRGGERLPMNSRLPSGDYYAIVSRSETRPNAEVYAWSIRQHVPTIAIPLRKGDLDVPVDLQQICTTVYERARYDLSVDYQQSLSPPLSDFDSVWLQNLLQTRIGP